MLYAFRLSVCHLSLALTPFLASAVAQEAIELPSNLSPALRARLLAQNNVPQESVPNLPTPATPIKVAEPKNPATPAAVPPIATPTPAPGTATPAPPTSPPSRRPVTLPSGTNATRTGSTVPGAAPGTPGAATPKTAPPPDDPNDFTLAFAGAPIEDVIQEYERISERHVIRDANLAGNVVVVQNPNKKMTRDEGVDFIKASLLIQGFSLQEYRPGIDKILNIGAGKSPMLEPSLAGAPIYMSADELPDTDKPVNYLIRLNYLTAIDASQVLAMAVPTQAWGLYTAIPSANAILVRGAIPNIRTLIKIKDAIDIEPVPQVHEFVELERASAEDIQALLDGILQAQTAASTASGGTSGFRPVALQNAAAGLAGNPNAGNQPIISGGTTSAGVMPDGKSVIIKADPRTNRIFINGPKVHVDYLIKLVKEFDQPSKVKNLLTQQLRYIPVDDFLDIAAASLEARGLGVAGQSSGGGGAGGAAASGGARTGQTAGQNQFGGMGAGGGNSRNTGGSSGFGGSNGGSSGSGSRSSSRGGGGSGSTTTAALPRSTVVGKTLLISDPRMNSLLVTGPPESIERVSELIKEMDKRPLQVHINAVIAQITLGDNISTGFDLLRRVEDVQIAGQNVSIAGLYSPGGAGAGNFLDPANLDLVSGFTRGAPGLNLYATVGELFNAYVSALESTSRFKVLSKPHVSVANNETATIDIGERRPIPSNTQTSLTNNGSTISNIEYEDIVLSLEVTALVNSKNEITVKVYQVNDNVTGSVTIGENQVPIISTQTLDTKITVPNGAIFTIGGTITERVSQGVAGLPFISRIPVIKHLFGSTTQAKTRQELIILLQPRIIDTADDMIDVHASEIQRAIIGPEAETFAKPDRDTSDVILPTSQQGIPFDASVGKSPEIQLPNYEKDIPFDAAGYPNRVRPATKSLFRRLGNALRSN